MPHTPKRMILIIDDNPGNLMILKSMLTQHGFHATTASSGIEGMETAASILPDLVLLDINMPKMNGFEVCVALKENPKTNYIPVIFVSAFASGKDRLQAIEVGGADFVEKPFKMDTIIQAVNAHLPKI